MLMPGRQYTAGNSYRYGFNGKENDNEVKGEGAQQDYGMRIYDPRLGRFQSVDPITDEYPELTPYQFASNTPIQASDLDGLEADFSKGKMQKQEYGNNPLTWFGTFWNNTTASAWNTVVESTETSVNTLSSKGRDKIKSDVGNASIKVLFYIGGKSNEEKLKDIKGAAADPHTYEDLVGNYLLARTTGTVLSNTIKGVRPNVNATKKPLPALSSGKPLLSRENVNATYSNGEFSILNWEGYPSNVPKPKGPFKIITGEMYEAARITANKANAKLRKDLNLSNTGVDIHEIIPVKFGGSPTNIQNKVFIQNTPTHKQLNKFWRNIQNDVQKGNTP
jgi:RHS repeat-associated protein